jgi:hypothetical protein
MGPGYAWQPVTKGAWSGHRYWSGAGSPRPDSYMVWADATGFIDIAPDPDAVESVPILIELKEGKTAKEWAGLVKGLAYIEVPRAYAKPPEELADASYCTARVKPEFFGELARERRLRDWIERFEVGLPGSNAAPGKARETPVARNLPRVDDAESAAPWPAVVIATIDDNLAFAHARFREPGASRTRVEFFWDQGASKPGARSFGYGCELSRGDINACMAAASTGGHVDEDRAYRLAGYAGVSHRLAHGTHTMDLAGGAEPDDVDADASRHIWVQFPSRDNWGSSPLGAHVLDGLRYIVDRADSLARSRWGDDDARPPIVVSLPHANLGGPHDGSSILEKAMDELIDLRSNPRFPLDIVLPAGNNHLSRCHAHFDVAPAGIQQLEWRVLPDDGTPNFVEIWVAGGDPAGLELHVTPPGGYPEHAFSRGDVMTLGRGDSEVLCTVAFLERPGNGDGSMAFIAVGPTSTHRRPAGGDPAPSGTWTIRLENTGKRKIHIEAWIQRDDPVLGMPRYGRQSHFVDADYEQFEPSGRLNETEDDKGVSRVKRSGSFNGIGTGRRTVVVGAIRGDDGRSSAYSGRAHRRQPNDGNARPDVAAIGDLSWNRRGVMAAAIRSGSVFSMDGTSVAAAQVARVISQTRLDQIKGYEEQNPPKKPRAPRAPAQSHGQQFAHDAAREQEDHRPQGWVERVDSTRSGVGRVAVPAVVPALPPKQG